jgi:hypothetical protein
MALDIRGILDKLVSHALASGHFDSVNTFKIDEPAGARLTAGIWVDDITPLKSSGLASTSARLLFKVRLFSSTEAAPESYLEEAMTDATSALLTAYSGDFDLGASVRAVDLLGMEGVPLSANAHFMNLSGIIYRVMDIAIPVLVNDVWEQSA